MSQLQELKKHPWVQELIAGGKLLNYGAALLPEGGYYSLPKKFAVDGALLLGDALGSHPHVRSLCCTRTNELQLLKPRRSAPVRPGSSLCKLHHLSSCMLQCILQHKALHLPGESHSIDAVDGRVNDALSHVHSLSGELRKSVHSNCYSQQLSSVHQQCCLHVQRFEVWTQNTSSIGKRA